MVARRTITRAQVDHLAVWAYVKPARELSREVALSTNTVRRVISLLGVLDLLHPMEKQTHPEALAEAVLSGVVDAVEMKRWRLAIGYTQNHLALVAGVSITTIGQLELHPAEFKRATLSTRQAIAETIRKTDPRSSSYKPVERVAGIAVPLPRPARQ
tara:strand:+ start:188 stop:658 length:471 start_codon:yes stop_codon:yes gene_type:complete